MAEPSTSSFLIGAGVSSLATYVLGPVFGNYAVILGMGLLGTLVALTDEDFHDEGRPIDWVLGAWRASKFIFRGLGLSLAFAGVGALVVSQMLPKEYELTPYAVLSTVAFVIGWTSNKWSVIKERIVGLFADTFSRFFGGNK